MIDRSCGLSNRGWILHKCYRIHNEIETVLSEYAYALYAVDVISVLPVLGLWSLPNATILCPRVMADELRGDSPERSDKMQLVDTSTSRHL